MPAGDHLRVNRGGAVDHAIDAGDRTVIRWREGVGVERVERALFAPDGAAVEVVVHRERIFRPPLVVARAFSRFAESAYRAMFQSAEQFAVWCKSAQLPAVSSDDEAPARPSRKKAAPAGKPKPTRVKPAPKAARVAKAKPARKPAPKKAARKVAKAKIARKGAPRKSAARKVAKVRAARKGAKKKARR